MLQFQEIRGLPCLVVVDVVALPFLVPALMASALSDEIPDVDVHILPWTRFHKRCCMRRLARPRRPRYHNVGQSARRRRGGSIG